MTTNEQLKNSLSLFSRLLYGKEYGELLPYQKHYALAKSSLELMGDNIAKSRDAHAKQKRAYYFSIEYLMGRMVFNNLLTLGLKQDEMAEYYKDFEDIPDAALGNGGLGRLAACFLDSAATKNLPLDGYGIRYKYGLFKQKTEDGFQKELTDEWIQKGDGWSNRCEEESVTVHFKNADVKAVPYDMPIIGYQTEHVSNLRLWQAESLREFDFETFNNGKLDKARRERDAAENICALLYPNDSTREGKKLRFKQEYFFCSASLQDIVTKYKAKHGGLDNFGDNITIQLNDTHPAVSIPELVRILWDEENFTFDEAMQTANKVFAYTNHTVMPEAMEMWEMSMISGLTPRIAQIIKIIDRRLEADLLNKLTPEQIAKMSIIQNKMVHMVNLAVYVSKHVNGVAKIHTDIIKHRLLKDWHAVSPQKFQNKTNGITQRRWLVLCNPELSAFITELLGDDEWICDLDRLKELEKYCDDRNVLEKLIQIKQNNKRRLAGHILKKEGVRIDPDTVFDIHIKRLHEYKRQLLNILTILEMYFEIKDGSLSNFRPTTFIFGAKAAPGYFRAKAIIKLINEVARLIESDPEVSSLIKVVFVSDYNVSYAEKLIPAADVSEQISTAGTEASGTGNMKLMLNGAVTMGTLDGANIEIVEAAGDDNNYIFGAKAEEIEKAREGYSSAEIYKFNSRISRSIDALVNGTLDDGGSGMFEDLYNSLLAEGDRYFVLLDFENYLNKRIRLNQDFGDRAMMAKKMLCNIANAGSFSSDRTVLEYARDIWDIEPVW